MMGRRVLGIILAVAAVLLGQGHAATDADKGGSPAHWREPAAYVFTQQHRDHLPWWNGTWEPQIVRSGSRVTVQLPGDPITWEPVLDPDCRPSTTVDEQSHTDPTTTGNTDNGHAMPAGATTGRGHVTYLGMRTYPNDGRIAGAASVYAVDYRVSGVGIVAICLAPSPPTDDPTDLGFPPGSPTDFVLTLELGHLM